jgi:hypothetical protein
LRGEELVRGAGLSFSEIPSASEGTYNYENFRSENMHELQDLKSAERR